MNSLVKQILLLSVIGLLSCSLAMYCTISKASAMPGAVQNELRGNAENGKISPNPGAMRLYKDNGNSWGSSMFAPPGRDPGVSSSTGFKHLLKNMDTSNVRLLKLAAYFNSESEAKNASYEIKTALCTFQLGGNNPLSFRIGDIEKFNVNANKANESNACGRMEGTFTTPGNAKVTFESKKTGKWVVHLVFKLDGARNNTGTSQQIRFQVKLNGNGILANEEINAGTNFGIVEGDNSAGYSLATAMPFGLDCSVKQDLNRKVTVYDGDSEVFGESYFYIMEKGQSENSGGWEKLDYGDYGSSKNEVRWDSGAQRWEITSKNGNDSWITIAKMVNTKDYLMVFDNPDHHDYSRGGLPPNNYIGPTGNVLSFGIPGEAIAVNVDCSKTGEGNEDPRISIDPDTYSYYYNIDGEGTVKGEPKVDTPALDPSGNAYWPREPDWQIYEIKFQRNPTKLGDSPNERACDYARANANGGNVLSCNEVYSGRHLKKASGESKTTHEFNRRNTDPDPIGTYTCYVTRINTDPWISDTANANWPKDRYESYQTKDEKGKTVTVTYLAFDAEEKPPKTGPMYKYSNFECSLNGLDPKVQIQAHDINVGGDISTSLRDMQGGPQVGLNFGSWAEYGVEAQGVNGYLASGAGLLRGNTSRDSTRWDNLTFANIPNGTSGEFGQTVEIGDLSDNLAGVVTQQLTNSNLDPRTDLNLNKGAKNVYEYKGELTITGNIIFPDEYDAVNDIPRVVIKANSINITPGVGRIDAWLIAAPDNSDDENEGVINTCGGPSGRPTLPFSEMQLIYNGECQGQLVFNGPVYAKRLFLYRTGGSGVEEGGVNNPNDARALDRPAEIFNLRPDNFLSAYSGGGLLFPVARTDKVTELPPRF